MVSQISSGTSDSIPQSGSSGQDERTKWVPPSYKPRLSASSRTVKIAIAIVIILAVAITSIYIYGTIGTYRPHGGRSSVTTTLAASPYDQNAILQLVKGQSITYMQLSNSMDSDMEHSPSIDIQYSSRTYATPSNSPLAANYLRNGTLIYAKSGSNVTFFLYQTAKIDGKSKTISSNTLFDFANGLQQECTSNINAGQPALCYAFNAIISADPFTLGFLSFSGLEQSNAPVTSLGQKDIDNLPCTLLSYVGIQNSTAGRNVSFTMCISNYYGLPLNMTESITQNGLMITTSLRATDVSASVHTVS